MKTDSKNPYVGQSSPIIVLIFVGLVGAALRGLAIQFSRLYKGRLAILGDYAEQAGLPQIPASQKPRFGLFTFPKTP